MEAQQLVMEGFMLMFIGMGMVFVFLTLLVLATLAMSRVIACFVPADAMPGDPAGAVVGPASAGPADPALLAVIGAALHRHRQSRRPDR